MSDMVVLEQWKKEITTLSNQSKSGLATVTHW